MKTILKSLRALPLALIMAFGFTAAPAPSHSDEAAATASVSEAKFVDGNWFTIAESKGEAYKVGSPTNLELEAQLDLYQTAVESKNTADAEKYAIRSWVKANYAMLLGQNALESGNYEQAKVDLARALKLAKAAQRPGAGKGEKEDRVCDDTAAPWQGCSKVEGKRCEDRVKAFQKKLAKKTGAAAPTDGE